MNLAVVQPAKREQSQPACLASQLRHKKVVNVGAILKLRWSQTDGMERTFIYLSTHGLIAAHIRSPEVAIMKMNTTALSLLESRSTSRAKVSLRALLANWLPSL